MKKRPDDEVRSPYVVLHGDGFTKVGDVGRQDIAIDRQDGTGPYHLGAEFLTESVQRLSERMACALRVSVRPKERGYPIARDSSRASRSQNSQNSEAVRARPRRR